MDERELIDRMLVGDERAFDVFSGTFIPALYRFAFFRLDRDRELTRDIVQSTIVKVIDKLASFRGDSALMTWLCACCRTEIAMHFRKEGRRPREVELDDEAVDARPVHSPGPTAEPEQALLAAERRLLVHMALDLVNPRYRRALTWKYLEDLSVKEIARRLEVGPKAAESVLTRARRSFQIQFEQLLESRDDGDSKS